MMNNALDNLQYENTELTQEIDKLRTELRALKSQALFVRDCEGEPVVETIEVNGWQAKIFNDHESSFRFEIYNKDCDYVESEGGIVHYEAVTRVAKDLLEMYSEFVEQQEAKAVIGQQAWQFVFESEIETTLNVIAESYTAAQEKAYQIYADNIISFSNKDIKYVQAEHNVYSATHLKDESKKLFDNAFKEHKETLDNLWDKK